MAAKYYRWIERILFFDRLLLLVPSLQVTNVADKTCHHQSIFNYTRTQPVSYQMMKLIYSRLALAESSPPCIPYIGLILQDLTFVQIGNPDLLDGKINFAKRWQQFNILVSWKYSCFHKLYLVLQDNLRRFKKVQYNIQRNEDILTFFGEFDDYLSEDDLWNLSENIKPRGQSSKNIK